MAKIKEGEYPQKRIEVTLNKIPKPLLVYEAIIKFGPISLDDLYLKTGFSRSATFRALKHLEAVGWIRKSINNHQYLATAYIDELVSTGSTSLVELDIIHDMLSTTRFYSELNFRVGFYITKRSFCIMESSSKYEKINIVEYPSDSSGALTAYSCLYQDWKEDILFKSGNNCNFFERRNLEKQLSKCRYDIKRRGFFFCPDEYSAHIGIRVDNSLVGAISLKSRFPLNWKKNRLFLKDIKNVISTVKNKGFAVYCP